jgi:Tfp pilus assembly protein PilZ
MVQERDRRYSRRMQFDDAKVYCQENSTFKLFNQFSEAFALNDLTKSGVSFKTNKKISRGDQVQLKIDIPGQQKIRVKGRVVWVSEEEASPHAVGVQFLPFGTMKRYNSFSAREKLERLIGDNQAAEEEMQ